MRSGRPHSLLSAPLRSGWTPELFAAWPLSRFSNAWKNGPGIFQCLENLSEIFPSVIGKCGLAPLADLNPGPVSSAVSAVLRRLHPSKAVTSNTAPEAAEQFAPSARLRCELRGHLPDRRQNLPGALLDSRARHRSGWRGLAVAGVGPMALRGPASPGSLRAHPSRHGEAAVSCRLLRATFTGCGCGHFSLPKPNPWRGLRGEKCSLLDCGFAFLRLFSYDSGRVRFIERRI